MKALRDHDVDVVSASDVDMIGKLDEQHLQYATSQGLVLYSFNARDYMALHTKFLEEGQSHGGIILAAQNRYSVGEQMRRLLVLIAAKSVEEMKDQVVFLSAWS